MKSHGAKDSFFFLRTYQLKSLPVLILILTFFVLPATSYSQDSPISVAVNDTHYSTDELVVLSVTVIDDSPQQPRPILPPLDGLAVFDGVNRVNRNGHKNGLKNR